MRGEVLGRRRARKLCARFARVGVQTSPDRLRAMLAGAPVAASEEADVRFALIAAQIDRDARSAKYREMRREGVRSLLIAGMTLLALNFLLCAAYALLNLAQQTSPY
ncbi:hypothetical protein [Mycobacterium sherrisii]|uniref:Uncharacterized protein n=1 Tax=Mycobacterium sherrisii TaxID=243061 RepID=A0A1E3T2T6_9MYCO|nr:hypothetical protein [Mycobacterium sherrisii]MCV7029865.1 hypothetical protein [Mycobacterium sherrisii]MEC4762595.1 hypothetical protein [Mycobacterium sherrisii]ODR08711.1 hypothetical protein BHQ21_05940 [Mycobacterium sherrisii]ORW85054.1 hypothetical protein AWC25_23520 [Mycobacterium sherrisii]